MFRIAQRIAATPYQSGPDCEGINMHLADGEAAGQEVFHVHLHVIPRFAGDGFGLGFGPDHENRPDRETLEMTANRIRDVL